MAWSGFSLTAVPLLSIQWLSATGMPYPSIACGMFLHTILFTNDLTNLAFGILHLSEIITSMMGRLKMAPWHSQSCRRAYQAYHRPSPLNERCNALSNSLLIPSWLLDQHRQGSRQQLSFISMVSEIELHVSDEYFRSLLSLLGKGSKNQNGNLRWALPRRGGGSRPVSSATYLFWKMIFVKNHLESFPDCENVFCT